MTKVVWGVVIFGLVGCGSVSEEKNQDAAVDSARAIDASTDAPPTAPRCSPTGTFGAPVAIAELNTSAQEEQAYLSPDELTIYFSSTRDGAATFDLFTATRASRSAPWSNIVAVSGTNSTGANERYPMITGNGLTLYILTGSSPNYAISVSTRTTTSAAFTTPALVATINDATANDETGTILADDTAIYFSSNRTGDTANYDLYRSTKSNGTFGAPVAVTGANLNTAASEYTPVLTPDELTMYFGSNRAGGLGAGDIWIAKRTNKASPFDAPVNLAAINTADSEQPSWVSPDGCVLYFTVALGTGNDLYMATRGM